MVEKIKALLAPPAYPEDEDKARVAKLLHVILLALVILLSFNTVVAALLLRNVQAISLNAATVLLTLALFVILHKGYVRPAAILTVSLFWAALVGVSFFVTGFTIIIASSYFVIVFLAGILVSKRAGVLFAVMSIAAAAAAYWLSAQGLLTPPPENRIVDVSATAVNLFILAVIVYLNQQTLEDTLARAHENEKALEASRLHLEERVSERTRDLALANEIGRTVQTMRDVDMLLSGAIHIIQSYFNLYFAQIYLLNEAENTLVLRAAEGQAAERLMKQGHYLPVNMASINGRAAFEKQPQIVSNTAENAVFRPNPLLPYTRSEMAIPLKTADQVLGVLDLQSAEVGTFSEENLPAFEALAAQLAIAMENAQLFTERQETTAALSRALSRAETQKVQLALVNELAAALEESAKDLPDILEMTGHYLQEMLPSKFRSIALLNEDNTAVQMVALDASQESPPQSLTFPLEGTSMQFALAKGRVIWLPEETPLATFADMAMLAKQQIKSVLVTPLIIGSKVLGTLNLASERPSAYADVDENFILQISNLLANHFENQRLKDRLQQLADLVENHPDFIGTITTAGQVTYINAAGLAMMGLSTEQDVTHLTYSDLFDAASASQLREEGLPAALANNIWTGQITAQKADDTAIPVDITIAPIYDAANNPLGFSLTVRDITERVQAVDAQRRLTLQLEERLLQVNALQRTMTHEGWAEFLTAPNRLIQGFMFDNEQIRLLSQRDVTKPDTPQLSAEQMATDGAVAARPMLVRGETVGVLGARNPSGEPLSTEQQEMLGILSDEIAEALERARLFEEMELARQQMNALYSGIERVVHANSLDGVLHALVDSTPLSRMDRADLLFFDRPWGEEEPETLTVTAVWEKRSHPSSFPAGSQLKIEQLPTLRSATKDRPTILLDIREASQVGDDVIQIVEQLGIVTVVQFPLVVGDQWFGMLTAQSSTPATFSDDEIRQISSLVEQAASVSQTQLLFQQARDRARREQILREVTARVYAAADAEAVLRTAAKEVNRVLGVDTFVYLDESLARHNGRHHSENQETTAQEQSA
ncbi:MAG: GAF domain-containing protein [Anaerolineales bacterium]|nr:GAF domain-containing protein [Anaerolineales bacterium]